MILWPRRKFSIDRADDYDFVLDVDITGLAVVVYIAVRRTCQLDEYLGCPLLATSTVRATLPAQVVIRCDGKGSMLAADYNHLAVGPFVLNAGVSVSGTVDSPCFLLEVVNGALECFGECSVPTTRTSVPLKVSGRLQSIGQRSSCPCRSNRSASRPGQRYRAVAGCLTCEGSCPARQRRPNLSVGVVRVTAWLSLS